MQEHSSSISQLFSRCHLSSDKTCASVCLNTTSHVLTAQDCSATKATRNSSQLNQKYSSSYALTGQLQTYAESVRDPAFAETSGETFGNYVAEITGPEPVGEPQDQSKVLGK